MRGRGAIRIKGLRQEEEDGLARVVCEFEEAVPGGEAAGREAFFEMPSEHSVHLVSERADAFVVLALMRAIQGGFDIISEVPMSEDLHHNIVERLLPPLARRGAGRISVKAPLLPPLPRGTGVGARVSCDLDSLCVLSKYSGHPLHRYRLNGLLACDEGGSGLGGGEEDMPEARAAALERARAVSEETGTRLVEARTNAGEAFPGDGQVRRAFVEAFEMLSMRKLWRCCYYASGPSEGASERFLDVGLPEFERFLFSCISTTGMEIEVVGADMSRFEKLSAVSRFPAARKHLHSCSMSADNCSRCDGCSLDMLSLDALGRLDAFSGTYDVAFYRGHRDRYLRLMMSRKGDPLFAQAYAAFRKKGDPELSGMERVAAAVDSFDSLWKEGSEESCSRAVEILAPFSSDPHAALRLADAYASGKGVKKDRDKERRLRGTAADHLKREAEDGFVSSGERLFDILWDMGGRDDELMEAVVPGVQAGSPYSKACMSRMCAEGRGVEKDEDAAIMWMKEAAEGDPGRFSADYCGMLLGSKDPGRHSMAAEYCRSQIGIREDPALLAMLSEMCSKGKGTDRDQAEAVRLMRRAAAKDPSYETRYCRVLLDSDAHADHREAFEICSRLCKGRGGPDAWAMMAEMYSEGRGVTKNVVEASRWMRKAAEARPSRLSYEFCRMLQSSGVPELEEEAFRLAEDRYEKTGSDMYLAIIARACRDGKGTEKDIPKAVECMKKAVRSSSKYLREYCELLLASDREEDHAEAHRICSGIYKKSGTPFSCLAIATMYRDGKGVGKDLDKAMTWFGRYEDAAGSSDDLAYCDFVLAADDEGLHEAAWNICSERYKATGSSAYSGRIARMYRDGKGVGKDLEKAVEWMERSYTDDPDAWGEEFNDLLSKVE